MIYDQETGNAPDIILNPHAFPSRMTMGMLYELFVGNLLAKLSINYDASLFREIQYDNVLDMLYALGMEDSRYRTYIDPITGEAIQNKIFTGWVSYSQSSHIAELKAQEQGEHGNIVQNNLTGDVFKAVRTDDMTLSVMIEMVETIRSKQVRKMSDIYQCNNCNIEATFGLDTTNENTWAYSCPECGDADNIGILQIPISARNIISLLNSINVPVKMITEIDTYGDEIESLDMQTLISDVNYSFD